MTLLAVIRIRGKTGLKQDVRHALQILRLYKKNHCVIIPNTEAYVGMLKKLQEVVTWGEIDEATLKMLLQKRGKVARNEKLTEEYMKSKGNTNIEEFCKQFFAGKKSLKEIPGLKTFFKLSPPRKGFERKGIKTPFSMGGVLGYRKEHINELLQRMV